MISLIYVSRTLIDPHDRCHVLDDIETVSLARNSMLDLTGVLIAAPQHFVQLIEGPASGVTAVVRSISADPRHATLRIVREVEIAKANCRCWQMERFDTANFGDTSITPLFAAVHAGNDADAMLRLERLIAAVARS